MVPFNVKQKHETRLGKKGVSFIEFIEVNVHGHQYRLLHKQGWNFKFTIDGLDRPIPYNDLENGVKIFRSRRNMYFNADFGLKITWDGNHRAELDLCDSYANVVCGLCGNADGTYIQLFILIL